MAIWLCWFRWILSICPNLNIQHKAVSQFYNNSTWGQQWRKTFKLKRAKVCLLFVLKTIARQVSHLHHLRASIHQSVRADKEEQVPRLLAAAGPQVRPQPPAVPRHSLPQQDHSLWYEAWECASQATRKIRNQGNVQWWDLQQCYSIQCYSYFYPEPTVVILAKQTIQAEQEPDGCVRHDGPTDRPSRRSAQLYCEIQPHTALTRCWLGNLITVTAYTQLRTAFYTDLIYFIAHETWSGSRSAIS